MRDPGRELAKRRHLLGENKLILGFLEVVKRTAQFFRPLIDKARQFRLPALELPDTHEVDGRPAKQKTDQGNSVEPPGFIEVRPDGERNRCPG